MHWMSWKDPLFSCWYRFETQLSLSLTFYCLITALFIPLLFHVSSFISLCIFQPLKSSHWYTVASLNKHMHASAHTYSVIQLFSVLGHACLFFKQCMLLHWFAVLAVNSYWACFEPFLFTFSPWFLFSFSQLFCLSVSIHLHLLLLNPNDPIKIPLFYGYTP